MVDEHQRQWSRQAARRIVVVLLLVSPLDQIGFDLYAPALPTIGMEFAASNVLVQHTVTAYMMGMTIVVLPAGLIADAVGRKPVCSLA
jgi:DHA1 family bicyclomycin/chloramphenicol resistance-like MFS transporter